MSVLSNANQRNLSSGAPASANESEATINVASGIARALGQGITFGFADEAEAYIRSKFSDRDYKQIRDEIRGKINKFRDEEMGLAYGAEIAGSIATAFIPGGAAGTAARLAPTATKAVSSVAGSPLRKAMIAGGLYGTGVAEEIKDIPISASTGATVGLAAQALTPVASKAAKSLISKGASLSPGEKYGGLLGAVEKGVQSLPVVSGLLAKKGGLTEQSFAPMMYGQVMSELGKKLPVGLNARDAFTKTKQAFFEEYDKVLKGTSVNVNQELLDSLSAISTKYSRGLDRLAKKDRKRLTEFTQDKIFGSAKDGKLTGEEFKRVQKEIRRKSRNLMRKKDLSDDENNFLAALLDIDDVMMSQLKKSNPSKEKQLNMIDKAYSLYKPLERASYAVGTRGKAAFSADVLDREIKRQSASRTGDYIKGTAPLQKSVEEMMDVEPTISASLPSVLAGSAAAGTTAAGAGTVGLSTAGTAMAPLLAPLAIAGAGATKSGRSFITPRIPSALPVVGGKAFPGVIDIPSAALRSPAVSGMGSQIEGPQRYVRAAGEAVRGVPDYVMGLLR